MILKKDKIFLAGHQGLVGSAIFKLLKKRGYKNIIVESKKNLNLLDQNKVLKFLKKKKPKIVIVAAAKVGGIKANNLYKADFIRENLMIQDNLIHGSFLNNINSTINVIDMMVKNNIKYLIFSSSCAVYGETKDLLINEESQKNPINPYGLSKLICENIIKSYADIYNLKFISLRFFNVGGADLSLEVGECHNPETHLIPRAISCCLNDETLNIYGNQFDTIDGFAIRDFIHVNDLADAIYKSLKYLFSGGSNNYINLGTGLGFSVKMILDKISSHFNKKINYKIYNQKSGNPPMLVSDNAKAAKILNWHPLNSDLKTIISTACDWYDVASKKGYL